jgi:cardiolipin synthase
MKSWRATRPWALRGWPLGIVIGFAITAGALLVAQDQETLRIQTPIGVDEPRFPQYVAALVGAPVEKGDAYTVLRNGDETFPAMLEAIRTAKSRISLETYIYKDSSVGDAFTRALVEACRRGVTVRVVLDSVGANLSKESQKRLTDAGAVIVWFNPLRPWTIEDTNYRTHRKILVVDGAVGFTGGIGFDDQWLGNATDKEHWRDTQFKVVARSRRRFMRTGSNRAAGLSLRSTPRIRRRAPTPARLWCGAIPRPAPAM